MREAVLEGHKLNREQAEALERQLVADPAASEARARLIGYYFTQVQQLRQDTPASVRAARGRHIGWFIQNDPASEVLATSDAFAMSGWMHDPGNYKVIRSLWLVQVARSPDRLPVLMNAVYLFQQHDRPDAVELMRKAYRMTSGNDPKIVEYFGLQLGLLWLGSGASFPPDRKALETELDSYKDARLSGSVGQTIVQYSNPGGEPAEYARRLLYQALATTPDARLVLSWERALQRIQRGLPGAYLFVPGPVQLAKRIGGAAPEVPAQGAGSQPVFVNAVIEADGTVSHTIAISGPPELQSAAAAAVKGWHFEPTLVNGTPVQVFSSFEIQVGNPR